MARWMLPDYCIGRTFFSFFLFLLHLSSYLKLLPLKIFFFSVGSEGLFFFPLDLPPTFFLFFLFFFPYIIASPRNPGRTSGACEKAFLEIMVKAQKCAYVDR